MFLAVSNRSLIGLSFRFIHHIVVNSDTPQFDVENLSKQKMSSSLSCDLLKCVEIHAGGITRIEQHLFQNTANYLRRTKSFGLATTNKDASLDIHSADSNGSLTGLLSQSMMNLAGRGSSPLNNDLRLDFKRRTFSNQLDLLPRFL